MFVVRPLYSFPEDACPFSDEEELKDVIASRGLEVNESMCTDCPPMSSSMVLPHIFAHVYSGLEMLERGKEEWQMCQIVRSFVKDNVNEMKCDTEDYFLSLSEKQTVSRYVWSLSHNFKPFDAVQVYLFARACNSHTRVHFSNYVLSTIEHTLSHSVALDLAVVGNTVVPLHSIDHEPVSCVVGEVKWLLDPDEVEIAKCSEGEESDVKTAVAMEAFDSEFDENVWEWHKAKMSVDDLAAAKQRTKPCYVSVERLSARSCRQLMSPALVCVERLPRSTLNPNAKFCTADKSKSDQFPGRIFKGCRNWTQCVVPAEKESMSVRMPGYVFSGKTKPRTKPSKSSTHPGTVFRSYHASSPMPKLLNVQLQLKRVSPPQPCTDVNIVCKFNCLICKNLVADTRALVKCHIESEHDMFTCRNAHCVAGFRTEKGRDVHAAVHIKKSRGCP